ncbi:hypothetical protein GCM10028803_00140 [Larkinella knui]|uniref:Uncharacterized protein n=1 Tax=Larkinella knui TaxID=2025310 RepID=A0A3P1CJA1_9BACT|nr:hypothetical protein EHT87_14190 [Larkinella knui]
MPEEFGNGSPLGPGKVMLVFENGEPEDPIETKVYCNLTGIRSLADDYLEEAILEAFRKHSYKLTDLINNL